MPEVECQAWMGLTEVGMQIVEGGFCEREHGVGKAIGKPSHYISFYLITDSYFYRSDANRTKGTLPNFYPFS